MGEGKEDPPCPQAKIAQEQAKQNFEKEESKKEEKTGPWKEKESSVMMEPARTGEASIFVEKKMGKPGDKIMINGELNEVAPDAKVDNKEPPPPAKKGVELKLTVPLASDVAPGS